jgi:hypothetical protein
MPRCPPPSLIAPSSSSHPLNQASEHSASDASKEQELEKYYDYIANFLREDMSAAETLSQHPSRSEQVLGKRGRAYVDTWDEERYLRKEGYDENGIQVLDDWDELFRDYSDSHDGVYREWQLSETPAWKKRLKEIKRDVSIAFIPPPVAVSIHHPACWGIGNRIDTGSCSLNTSIMHPAAYSTTIVHPPAKQAQVSRKKEEYDEIARDWNVCQEELIATEAKNYASLCQLHHYAGIAAKLATIRSRRQRTHELIDEIYAVCKLQGFSFFDVPSTRSSRQPGLSARAGAVPSSTASASSSAISNNSSREAKSFRHLYDGSAAATVARSNAAAASRKRKIGSLDARNVPNADFILDLQTGKVVEAFIDNKWTLAEVLRLAYDGSTLRRVKVSRPLHYC